MTKNQFIMKMRDIGSRATKVFLAVSEQFPTKSLPERLYRTSDALRLGKSYGLRRSWPNLSSRVRNLAREIELDVAKQA
ncbi:MAG: hypothetical protein MN733_36850 [Nitrososphaera sp.]|nr:hypothetical protein [Nitrososphaera sp.]